MRTYHVRYKMSYFGEVRGVDLAAKSKVEAYFKAVYEVIPQKEKEAPYSAWVSSCTYNNGGYIPFNTFEGKPY